MHDARHRKRSRAKRDTGHQHDARADMIDQKSRRRLQHGRDDIERRQRQRQIV